MNVGPGCSGVVIAITVEIENAVVELLGLTSGASMVPESAEDVKLIRLADIRGRHVSFGSGEGGRREAGWKPALPGFRERVADGPFLNKGVGSRERTSNMRSDE
jgi:hypothetical protein